jgi:hypothetical protein
MAIGDGVFNASEVISVLPPELLARIDSLLVVFKAVGIAFIAYVVYILVMAFINYKKIKRMRFIEKKVVSIENKLDLLLKEKKKKKK